MLSLPPFQRYRHGETLAALSTAALENVSAALRIHPFTESVSAEAALISWLVCTFHKL